MERKAEELRVLAEMRLEGGFTPRASLARTPPKGFSTPPEHSELLVDLATPPSDAPPTTSKRTLSSPEEVQEAVRRRLGTKRVVRNDVPPIGGILMAGPAAMAPLPTAAASPTPVPTKALDDPDVDPLAGASIERLAGMATAATRGIMEAVRSKTSKLNKDEVATIGAQTERISAVLVHLALRVAAAGKQGRSCGTGGSKTCKRAAGGCATGPTGAT